MKSKKNWLNKKLRNLKRNKMRGKCRDCIKVKRKKKLLKILTTKKKTI